MDENPNHLAYPATIVMRVNFQLRTFSYDYILPRETENDGSFNYLTNLNKLFAMVIKSFHFVNTQPNNLTHRITESTFHFLKPHYRYICLSMALQPFVGLWPLFSFLILYTVGRTPWTGDQPVARPLPTHRTTQTQYKRRQTSLPRVGFEPTTPMFEQEKNVHAFFF
jgi:hypothetical protein